MYFQDCVYGKIKISDPIALEIINTPTIQRLKGIDQAGYQPLWVKPATKVKQYDHTRFAHSLGVYFLLKKFGTPLEEQIAGLIHDVSHSAFSHCIDYVLEKGSEKNHSYQDSIYEEYVKKSEIPSILKKYNLDLEYILNEANFPLLEKKLPGLCADRIDYSLKTAVIFEEINKQQANDFINNLVTQDNKWIFKNFIGAKKFAQLFSKINKVYYSGLPSAYMFRVTGDCLRYAFDKGYIAAKDLYTTDEAILNEVQKHLNDKKLKLYWDRMNKKFGYENNPKNYDAHVFCKSRVVDPLCKDKGQIKRVSEIDSKWGDYLKRESKPKEYFLKFESEKYDF